MFFNDTATTEIYTLSLHDALPISSRPAAPAATAAPAEAQPAAVPVRTAPPSKPAADDGLPPWMDDLPPEDAAPARSEEHTSELQSRQYLVCRLLLEKQNIPLLPLP